MTDDTPDTPPASERRAPDDVAVSLLRHERRKNWHTPDDCEMLLSTRERLDDGAARMERIEVQVCGVAAHQARNDKNLARVEAKIDENSAMNEELLSIIRAGKGFFKVAGWVASAVKWTAGLALPLIGLWFAIKGGGK